MSLLIRAATAQDSAALARLAGLDSRTTLRGRALVAEQAGAPVAAIGLTSGVVVADPFAATGDAVRALRERRYRLLRQSGDVGSASAILRRLAPPRRTVRPHPLGGHLQAIPEA